MSLKYKYDEKQRDEQSNKTDPTEQTGIIRHDAPAKVRNVHFIDLKKNHYVFNYTDLRMIEYSPETKKVILTFNLFEVVLEGLNMDCLIEEFAHYLPKQISAANKRYNAIRQNEVVTIVNVISIIPKIE